MSFWDAYDFWRDPMLGVLLCSVLCGWLGVYVVLRRVVFVGAAVTQISGVGIALTFWVASFFGGTDAHHGSHSWWLSPEVFSLVAAVGGALLFSFNRGGRKVASETIVGIGWVIAAASVVLVLSSKRIVQEAHEVDDLLYGTAVLVRPSEVKILAGVVAGILAVHIAFYKELMFVTYDSEMARTLGYRTTLWDMLLYATFGVGLSFVVRTVGALPAFGLLVIPAAIALLIVRRVRWAFPLAILIALMHGGVGYYLAFKYDYPTGAAIVAAPELALRHLFF